MTGSEFLNAVRKRYIKEFQGSGTDHQVAQYLGITFERLAKIDSEDSISATRIAELLSIIAQKTSEKTEENAIKPIVEFFPIRFAPTTRGTGYEVLSIYNENGVEHPYYVGLSDLLKSTHGIYIFHDSRGRALYVGKARMQNLWKEINLAYNRDRQVQTIRRVDHPERMQAFRTSDEVRRRIKERAVPLCSLATYFSAFQVADKAINNLEALLIRSFPNDILNKKMENFSI